MNLTKCLPAPWKIQLDLKQKTFSNSNMASSTSTIKNFRKFKSFDFYNSEFHTYYLLPYRFHQINNEKEVLVNEVGDFIIVPIGTAKRIADKEVNQNEDLYADLIANFFIAEKPIPELIDILATRYRTKKSFLD